MANDISAGASVRRHRIRSALWGAILCSGITVILVNFSVAPFDEWPLLTAPIAGGTVVGGLWGRLGRIKTLQRSAAAALSSEAFDAARSRATSPEAQRAAQPAAGRQAQVGLQNFAQANADEAMCAALTEAQTDVPTAAAQRVGRHATAASLRPANDAVSAFTTGHVGAPEEPIAPEFSFVGPAEQLAPWADPGPLTNPAPAAVEPPDTRFDAVNDFDDGLAAASALATQRDAVLNAAMAAVGAS